MYYEKISPHFLTMLYHRFHFTIIICAYCTLFCTKMSFLFTNMCTLNKLILFLCIHYAVIYCYFTKHFILFSKIDESNLFIFLESSIPIYTIKKHLGTISTPRCFHSILTYYFNNSSTNSAASATQSSQFLSTLPVPIPFKSLQVTQPFRSLKLCIRCLESCIGITFG